MRLRLLLLALLPVAVQCSSTAAPAPTGTMVYFDLHADVTQTDPGDPSSFYAIPYPSDLRLTPEGTPDVRGFPNSLALGLIDGLKGIAGDRKGFPQIPVAYFRFTAPVTAQDPNVVIAADASSPLLLMDVDEQSPDRGKLLPVVAQTLDADRYLPDDVLAVSARPGFILHQSRKYAFVVMKKLDDAAGKPLAAPQAFTDLQALEAPAGDPELAAWKVYEPLWKTLRQDGLDPADVAAATVFTTGDVVQDLADLSTKVIAKYSVQITDLHVPQGGDQGRFCEVLGKVTYPQFQTGTPLFDTGGLFQMGPDGLPVHQRDEDAPIAISLPNEPMPANGYPLIVYFHGSGGLSTSVIDSGPLQSPTDEVGIPGQGPSYVMAPHGFAMAGSALPVNPERVPGAPELAYLNFNNPASFRDIFRQGVIEQRMFISALASIQIDPTSVSGCSKISLPNGASTYHFDTSRLGAQGQSMGGMYTNLVSAVDPRIKEAVPTGAGGFWAYQVLLTTIIPGAAGQLRALLGTQPLTYLHPTLSLLETAWEPAEPYVYMPRVARMPLPGAPVRSIYEIAGKDDPYFPIPIYDGAALAYGHKEAGDEVWSSMQDALKLVGLDGILPYPVSQDLTSADGTKYTGAIIQYNGDGVADAHAIYRQLDAVKYQYGCFHETFFKTGVATIPAPAPLGTPCPGD